jgi:hypothetical protein
LRRKHKPRICHHEQRTLGFRIMKVLHKLKTFLSVSPIPLYQLGHASPPKISNAFHTTVVKKIRSERRHLLRRTRRKEKVKGTDRALLN